MATFLLPAPACQRVTLLSPVSCHDGTSRNCAVASVSSRKLPGNVASVQFLGEKLQIKTRNVAGDCSAMSPLSKRGQTRAQVERSYVMVKPDGVQRGLVGEVISRFERKGFTLKGLKLFQCPRELAQEHYKDLKEKPFYGKLVDYIVSGPVVAMVWEGEGVVLSARKLIGATNPLAAEPGTIRGDFAVAVGRNVIHGSDSPENGEREIGLWFEESEVVEWAPALAPWLLE